MSSVQTLHCPFTFSLFQFTSTIGRDVSLNRRSVLNAYDLTYAKIQQQERAVICIGVLVSQFHQVYITNYSWFILFTYSTTYVVGHTSIHLKPNVHIRLEDCRVLISNPLPNSSFMKCSRGPAIPTLKSCTNNVWRIWHCDMCMRNVCFLSQ